MWAEDFLLFGSAGALFPTFLSSVSRGCFTIQFCVGGDFFSRGCFVYLEHFSRCPFFGIAGASLTLLFDGVGGVVFLAVIFCEGGAFSSL